MEKSNIQKLVEMFDGIKELVDENEDVIDDIFGSDPLVIQGDDNLKEWYVRDDEVQLVAESKGEIDEIAIGYEGGNLVVEAGGEEIRADVPDDVDTDTTEATYKNGVLTVKVERNNGTD